MKRHLIIQCIILLIGTILLFNSNETYEISNKFVFKYLYRKYHFTCSKIILHKGTFRLSNCEIQQEDINFSCPYLNISFGNILQGKHQIKINAASLRIKDNVFENLNAKFEIKRKKIRGIITANNENIQEIHISCFQYLPINSLKRICKFPQNSSKNFHIKTLDLDISYPKDIQLYYKAKKLQTKDLQIPSIVGSSSWKVREIHHTLKIPEGQFKNYKISDMNAKFHSDLCYSKFSNVNLTLNSTIDYLSNSYISCHTPQILPNEPFKTNLHILHPWISANGYVNVKPNLKLHSIEKLTGNISQQLFNFYATQYNFPYELEFQKMNFKILGDYENISIYLTSKEITLQQQIFKNSEAHLRLKNSTDLSYKLKLSSKLQVQGQYDLKNKEGFILCDGCFIPKLTYPLQPWLPKWWNSFLSDFKFKGKYPYANFKVQWDAQQSTTFGNVDIHQGIYKDISFKNLNVTFGHHPSCLYLKINTLKTNSGNGACEIYWPYNPLNDKQEVYIFKGIGSFKNSSWQKILRNITNKNSILQQLSVFDQNSTINANFDGLIGYSNNFKEFLNIHIESPQTIFKDFDIQSLKFDYQWTPRKTLLNHIRGNLFSVSPFIAQAAFTDETFNLKFQGKTIDSQNLLTHPLLKNWTAAIPEQNLSSYQGNLDLEIECQGQHTPNLSLTGNGHITFNNENLSKIHLLGPLSNLFSKKIKWQPSIQFNQLIADFSFTQDQISSDKMQLLGPSTRADVKGTLNLKDQTLSGNIHFSFLDYQQLKFPGMRHLFQIFQPISKGFSASIKGSFEKPQWKFTFNPLRFVIRP